MARYAYVNGRYLQHAADSYRGPGLSVRRRRYEVILIHAGRLADEGPHLDHLDYSLRALQIPWPMTRTALQMVLRELVAKNGVSDGTVYLQVSCGVAPRDHKFPTAATSSFVATTKRHVAKATG